MNIITGKERIESLKKKLGLFILPLCLGAAIISSIIYDYAPGDVQELTAVSVLFEIAVFMLLDRLYNMKHKRLGGAICFLTLAAALYIMGDLIRMGYMTSRIPFNNWFYYPTDGVELYLYALVFAGGYLFYAALYYFTQVRYRAMFTLLLVIFPFAIYAKRLDVMPSSYLAAILFFYLLVMVHNRQTSADSGIVVVPDIAYITSILVFAAAAVGVLFILPKPEIQSIQEKDASVFDDLSLFNNEAPIAAADFANSSTRDHGVFPTGQELFYVNTSEDTLYLKTQSYSYFEDNTWYYGKDKIEEADYVWTEPAKTVPGMAITCKLRVLEEYSKSIGDEQTLALIDAMRQKLELSHALIMIHEGYEFKYLTLPEGTVSAGISSYYDEFPPDYAETGFSSVTEGNIFCNGEWQLRWPTWQYSAEYYSNSLIRELASELGLTTADWSRIMDWYYDYGSDRELYRNVNSDRRTAQIMDSGEFDDFDGRIRQLAFEITEGCESDYEKAAALERYFTDEGFIYDLEYIPSDESIEYFIFESKTGICSDFATAMTLMARSVGLTARYCEGFIAYENAGYDQVRNDMISSGISLSRPKGWERFGEHWYLVRDNYAHAFVEVYLPACGWVVFEPTVPSFTDAMMFTPSESTGNNIIAIMSQTGFYVTIGLIAAAVAVIIILYRPISEAVFRAYAVRTGRKRALKKLYGRTVKRLSRKTDTDLSAYTVKQVCDYAASFDMDISLLASAFERSFYGKLQTDDSGFAAAYEQYKQAYRVKIKTEKDEAQALLIRNA